MLAWWGACINIAGESALGQARRMAEGISRRLLDQRLRNRIMEALLGLVEWQDDLRAVGFAEHFESFFDFFPYEDEPETNGAITSEERIAIAAAHGLMVGAMNDTPRDMTIEQYVATGWPQRIAPVAEKALRLMLARGRFSEQQEEAEPSSDDGWPWSERFARSR